MDWLRGRPVGFGVLGPLVACHQGVPLPLPRGRPRVLLAVLLLRGGQVVPAGELAEIVWEGRPPPTARAALHNQVTRLRRALGAAGSRVRTQAPGYLLDLDGAGFDVAEFTVLHDVAGAAVRAGEWEPAADAARAALGLWRGPPLADVDCDELRLREVPRLEQLHLQALEWRIDADLHLGRHAELVPQLQALTTGHPLREHFHAQLMLACYRSGRRGEALEAYQRARRVLVDELGVEPGAELQDLQQRILHADPAPGPTGPGSRAAASGNREPAAAPAGAGAAADVVPVVPVVPRQLPAAVPHFTGRAAELEALSGLLEETGSGAVVISAIGGTAGVGKTALAVHWAHQVCGRFPDGQLYANLRGFGPSGPPVTAAEAIRGFLGALAVPPERIPAGLDAQAGLYRSLLAGRQVLIVLDNARDADQVRPLLPGSPGCLVVVTSRRQLTGLAAADGAHLLTLRLLTSAEARELLTRRLGPDRIQAETGAVTDLITTCAHLPLALNIAAARAAARPGHPLGALAAELRRTRLDALDTGDTTTGARTVFSWSYRNLTPPAARMFRLLGLHPGPDISAPAAASLTALPPSQAHAALTELVTAHLLTEHTPGRYTLHDLLRAYATEQTRAHDSETARRAATHRLLDHYLHTALAADQLLNPARAAISVPPRQPGADPEGLADSRQALSWFETERSGLLAAINLATEDGFTSYAWQLPYALATFLYRQGHWHDWAATQRTALAAAELLADEIGQAHARHALGRACIQLGDRDEALAHLSRALDLFRSAGDSTGEGRVHMDIARTFEGQGRYREDLRHCQQALRFFQTAGHRLWQAEALNAVGWCYAHLADHQRALTCCEQALSLCRELGYHYGEAATWDSLGYVHHRLGHHREAADCYQHTLDLLAGLGNRHREAGTLTHLGDAHHSAGNSQAARDAWNKALVILDELHHPDASEIRARLRGRDCQL